MSNTNEKIITIFQEHFHYENEVSGNLSRHQVPEWTSLNHVMFFIKLEKEFGIKFSTNELIEASDISRVKDLVGSKIHEK